MSSVTIVLKKFSNELGQINAWDNVEIRHSQVRVLPPPARDWLGFSESRCVPVRAGHEAPEIGPQNCHGDISVSKEISPNRSGVQNLRAPCAVRGPNAPWLTLNPNSIDLYCLPAFGQYDGSLRPLVGVPSGYLYSWEAKY